MKELYKGLGHIAIYTADMEESIAFYEKIGGSVYKRDGVHTPEGEKKLALVEFAGFLLELIQPPEGTLVPAGEGSIPHFAVYVDDLDKAAEALKAAGVHLVHDARQKGAAGDLRRPAELVLHRPVRRGDRAAADALSGKRRIYKQRTAPQGCPLFVWCARHGQ